MEKQKGITLIGLIVVIAVILFVFFIVYLALDKVRKIAFHNVCGTNLKGLGTAMMVYAYDYDDNYPQLPGTGPWSKELGFPYFERPDFNDEQSNTPRNITASLYLLVKEADVSPKSFVCIDSPQTEFDGSNPQNKDIVELFDFGTNPYEHVSYAYHNPYGKYPPDGIRSAAFAVAADMSPWFRNGDIQVPQTGKNSPQIIQIDDSTTWKYGISLNHQYKHKNYSEGPNVLFADGHTTNENFPNVGVQRDNIYTFWSAEENPSEQDIQGGTAPTGRSAENDAKSQEDSFLAI